MKTISTKVEIAKFENTGNKQETFQGPEGKRRLQSNEEKDSFKLEIGSNASKFWRKLFPTWNSLTSHNPVKHIGRNKDIIRLVESKILMPFTLEHISMHSTRKWSKHKKEECLRYRKQEIHTKKKIKEIIWMRIQRNTGTKSKLQE